MSAQDNLSSAQFYHGTNAALKPGEFLTPGGGRNFDVPGDDRFVHITTDVKNANGYADYAGRKAVMGPLGDLKGPVERHVYEVEPTGAVEHDESVLADQHRTRHPVKISRELPYTGWE